MANVDAPFGATPIEQTRPNHRYAVSSSYGTALGIGDPVKTTGGLNAEGIPYVQRVTAGNYIRGFIVGIEPSTTNLDRKYLAASTGGYVIVCDDRDAVFEIQEDSVGGAIAASNGHANCELIIANCSTSTGHSAVELDSSTATTTNTLSMKLLGIVQQPDNELGANAKWRARINLHELDYTTGTT